jgi:hypothetical protein
MKNVYRGWAWWHTPVIIALKRLRHEDHDFEASLDYILRPKERKEGREREIEKKRNREKGRKREKERKKRKKQAECL